MQEIFYYYYVLKRFNFELCLVLSFLKELNCFNCGECLKGSALIRLYNKIW